MPDNIIDDLVEAEAAVNDVEKELFFPDGTTLKLIKPDPLTGDFEVVDTLTTGWIVEFDENRLTGTVMIANNGATFNTDVKTVTHFQIGTDYYVRTEADPTDPQGYDPFWRFSIEKYETRDLQEPVL